MSSICGADCGKCGSRENCRGCSETGGCPFGEQCIAAQYIKTGGRTGYDEFKEKLLDEVNVVLSANGIPKADRLYELLGEYVNLEYDIPSGKKVKFLNDKKIYLGCQIEYGDMGICYGVVADAEFILLCSYSVDGSVPELIEYRKR